MSEMFVYETYDSLKEKLAMAGVGKGQHILFHTSLKSIGYIVGGAETVIRVLMDLVGEEGTLMAPSQTWKNLDPRIGVHWEVPEEYWDLIRREWPPYDKRITPSVGMGATAEMLRTWPGSERSDHPARSFVANGKLAKHLTENHDISNIFGVGSPLDKLYHAGGYVLLIAVGYDKSTSLHLAEALADYPPKRTVVESSAVIIDGARQWISYETLEVDDSDFVQIGEDFEKSISISKIQVGNGWIRFMKQKELVDFAKVWMEQYRGKQ